MYIFNCVKFYYQNCGGIKGKIVDLRLNLLNSSYDIVLLTETWLQAGIRDSELVDDRYNLFRRDRDLNLSCKRDGGGVMVAVRSDIPAVRKCDWEDRLVEELYLLLPNNNGSFIICVAYIPPGSSQEVYEKHLSKLDYLHSQYPRATFCIVGDYNLPHLQWQHHSPTSYLLPNNLYNNQSRFLVNTIDVINVNQYNRFTNCNNRILDLLLCSSDCTVSAPDVILVNIDNHHPPFQFVINVQFQRMRPRVLSGERNYNFFKADFDRISLCLNRVDWTREFDGLRASESVDKFYRIVYEITDRCVPLKGSKTSKYPVWFSPELKRALKRKEKVWIKWKTYNSLSHYAEYSFLRGRCKRLLTSCYSTYTSNVEASLPKNIKFFWKYVNSMKSNRVEFPSIMHYGNSVAENPSDIAELFSDFFRSVFEPHSCCNASDLDRFPTSDESALVPDLIVNYDMVLKILRGLDITKGPGPDRLSPALFKHCALYLAQPLSLIFNLCLHEGIFPNVWKLAYVTPIHKSGSRNDVSNYRPISILSCIPKVLETLIKDYVYQAISMHIIDQQHGFVKGRSTVTNLTTYSDYLYKAMDRRQQVDSVYTDFRKAFDKVDHLLMLQKLAFNGIKGNLLRWFASYLSNRSQVVIINGYASETVPVTSGVVQGSIIGPLLYIVFINDICQCFPSCNILLFADDLKIFKTISTIQDCYFLQNDLCRFHNYCLSNKLFLALDKCNVITFTKNLNIIQYTYNIGGLPLTRVTHVRDLGVTYDEKLRFDIHIDSICSRAYRMLGFIFRQSKSFKNPYSLLLLYKTLVRSQLEYASVAWNPHYAVYSNRIELVQKSFIRRLHFKFIRSRLTYESLLQHYELFKLSDRRTFLDLMFLFDLCLNSYNCPMLLSQICFRVPPRPSRLHSLFSSPIAHTNAGLCAPLNRLCKTYDCGYVSVDIFSNTRSTYRRDIQRIMILNTCGSDT